MSCRRWALKSPRLSGLSDRDVQSRYAELRLAVLQHAAESGVDVRKFEVLERAQPEASPPGWETWVMISGVADEVDVVRKARRLWEALGPNEYARVLRSRPRTYRGYAEGNLWLGASLVPVPLMFFAFNSRSTPFPWWLWVVLAAAWLALVGSAWRRRLQRPQRVGGAELPHL